MSDETIFREVDEEFRQEQLKKIWDKYGWYIAGVAVAIVLGVAGMKGWKAWTKSSIEASGASFARAIELVEAGRHDEARERLKQLAKSGYGGYKSLARIKAADLAVNDKQAQVEMFDAIAKDRSIDKTLRQLARIRAAFLRVDEANANEIRRRLEDLNTPLNPWRHTARELLGLHAWKSGLWDKANEFYGQILADPASPADIRARAARMRDLVAPHLPAPASPAAK